MVLLAVLDVGGPVAVTLAALLAGERLVVAGLAGVLQQRVPLQQPRRRERRQADAAATRQAGQAGEAAVAEDGAAAGASVRARPLHQRAPSARFQSEGERDLQQQRILRRTLRDARCGTRRTPGPIRSKELAGIIFINSLHPRLFRCGKSCVTNFPCIFSTLSFGLPQLLRPTYSSYIKQSLDRKISEVPDAKSKKNLKKHHNRKIAYFIYVSISHVVT